MSADVSILIITYNSAAQIAECLQSVLAQRRSIEQEIIVLDNNSTDETIDIVRQQFPSVILLTPGRNLGFAAGVNLAARHATAAFILLLNPDTIVLHHAIDVLVEFAQANATYGLYGGRTLKTDGSLERSSCWGMPNLWSLIMFATGLNIVGRNTSFFDPESLGRWQRDTVREVGVITGCLLLVSRTIWKKLDGFDERYFMYGEDADLAKRARTAGFRPVICPAAQIIHEVGQSSVTPTHKMMLLYRGKACFFRTHYRGPARRLALLLLVAGVGLRALANRIIAFTSSRETSNDWQTIWRDRAQWLPGYPPKTTSSTAC